MTEEATPINHIDDHKPDDGSVEQLKGFYDAIKAGDIDAVSAFITEHRIDCNSHGGNLGLILAAREGHHQVGRLLVERGANMEVRLEDGKTPLILAVDEGHYMMAQMLLDLGADIEAKTNTGVTSLMRAALGRIELVTLLLDHGADPHGKTQFGETAIYYASVEKHKDIVSLLRSRGAKK